MADGVDHIDIYADVGEEFNQAWAQAHAAGWAALRRGTRTSGPLRATSPARLQTVRPWRQWAAPPGRRSARLALVLPRRFVGGGRRHPPRGSADAGHCAAAAGSSPRRRLAPHCWRRPAGASRLARPGRRGGVRGRGGRAAPCAPSPAAARSRKAAGRAPAFTLPRPCRSGSDSFGRSFCVSVVTGSPHGRPCSRPFVSRAQLPELPCPRLRQVSAWRHPFFLLSLFGRRLRCGHVCNKSADFRTHGSCLKSRCTGPTSVFEGLQCL